VGIRPRGGGGGTPDGKGRLVLKGGEKVKLKFVQKLYLAEMLTKSWRYGQINKRKTADKKVRLSRRSSTVFPGENFRHWGGELKEHSALKEPLGKA